jgi:hypothetical protein
MISPEQLTAWDRTGDALADATVAALMPATDPLDTTKLREASQLMAGWTTNGSLPLWPATPMPGQNTESVAALQGYLAQGALLPGWADPEKVARAEQLFMEHGPLSCALLFCTSLPECYVLPHLAEVLHIAGQLEAHTEHRIRQTAAMVFPVMMRGGLLSPAGSGVAQVLKVRLIHATIRHLILRGEPSKVSGPVARAPSEAPRAGLYDSLMAHGWDPERQGMPCSQVELAYTLLTFGYCFLEGMRRLGQRLPEEDEEACLHAWNVMGHVLGIQRELMADTMAEARQLFQDIRQRALSHRADPDPRPPLGRALMQTMGKAIELPVIRHLPVPLTQWLIGPDTARKIGISENVPWLMQAVFRIGLTLTLGVDSVVRLVAPKFSFSRMFTRIIGYHVLTRFLMDQTRALNLPSHLQWPLQETIAAWSDDPHAPDWINHLENRFTTRGDWQKRA